MNHMEARAAIDQPAGMYLGTLLPIEGHPSVSIMSVFGGKGALAPGCYLIDARYSQHGRPLGGPFDSPKDASNAYLNYRLYSQNTARATERLAFVGENSIIYDMVSLVRAERIQMGRHSRVDSLTKLEGGEGLLIGDHVHIASLCHIGIGGGLTILEDGSSFASGAKVISGSNMPDAPSMSATAPKDQQRIVKFTTRICKNAAVLTNAVIMPGVTVGEGARVAAGAVVRQDVPPFTLVAGVPAVWKRDLQ